MHWVGIDIGGTFTDVIVYDLADGRLRAAKTLSTPAEPIRAVVEGLSKLAVDLPNTSRFVHGTTRVTNALLERAGAPVALVTTAGFRDVIEMGLGHRTRLYSVKEAAADPLVPRHLRFEVAERMRADGTVETPLDETGLHAVLEKLAEEEGVEGLAVCFLHAYGNPAHERRTAELVAERFPGLSCSLSSEVVPEIGEYERFVTTVLNVSVKPVVDAYLGAFEGALAERGYAGRLSIMTSSGGVVSAERARQVPVQLALSGPAGGVAASAYVAGKAGFPNVITCDMGGTSTDVCLIRDGLPAMTNQGEIGGWPNKTFQVEIQTIGAGGGSIAWRDIGGELSVGPRSAGSTPGPACYGRGGDRPTLTDAHLLVGHLDPEERLGGEVTLDTAAALRVMAELAADIGDIAVEDLALGVIKLAVARMTSTIKAISVARGHDPRDFTLLPFGGAGPMHATLLADELGMTSVLVPPVPGNLSALGFVTAQARQDMVRTMVMAADDAALQAIAAAFAELEAATVAQLRDDGLDETAAVTFQRSVGMRIKGQSHDLRVPVEATPDSVADLAARFRETYEARYAYMPGDVALEIVNCRVTALGPVPEIDLAGGVEAAASGAAVRRIYTDDGWVDAAVRDRAALPPGADFHGPAIIVESGCTTVVGDGWHGSVDPLHNLVLRRTDA